MRAEAARGFLAWWNKSSEALLPQMSSRNDDAVQQDGEDSLGGGASSSTVGPDSPDSIYPARAGLHGPYEMKQRGEAFSDFFASLFTARPNRKAAHLDRAEYCHINVISYHSHLFHNTGQMGVRIGND